MNELEYKTIKHNIDSITLQYHVNGNFAVFFYIEK